MPARDRDSADELVWPTMRRALWRAADIALAPDAPDLSATDWAVWGAVIAFTAGFSKIEDTPSLEQIGLFIGRNARTVRRSLSKLVAAGFPVTYVKGKGGRGQMWSTLSIAPAIHLNADTFPPELVRVFDYEPLETRTRGASNGGKLGQNSDTARREHVATEGPKGPRKTEAVARAASRDTLPQYDKELARWLAEGTFDGVTLDEVVERWADDDPPEAIEACLRHAVWGDYGSALHPRRPMWRERDGRWWFDDPPDEEETG